MKRKGIESWGFKILTTEDADILYFKHLDFADNRITSYRLFPGVYIMFIDFKHKYNAKDSEYGGRYGYRIGYSYEGNYYTYINKNKVLITREIFVGKYIPKAKESYSTSDRTIAFNISIVPKELEKDFYYYTFIEEFIRIVEGTKDIGYIISDEKIIYRANELIEILKNKDKKLIGLKTLELIYLISKKKLSDNRKKYYKKDLQDDINKIEEYLRLNISEKINLDFLSKNFKISKTNLNNKFIRKFQYTPMRYLNNLRMIEAEKLLIDLEKEITDIAQDVGFSNPSNFSRSFKKFTGFSPSEYRKNNIW